MLTRERRGPARPRTVFGLLLLALGLAGSACISSTPPPPDVAPPAAVEVDVPQTLDTLEPATEEQAELLAEYWDDRDAAFSIGAEAGISFLVEHNHPLLPYTVDDCREAWFGGEVPPGFAERTALQNGSAFLDPDFMMSTGPLAGRILGDEVLVMTVGFRYEGAPTYVPDRVQEVHLQIAGDDVRNFMLCDVQEVQVVQGSSAEATAATTGSTAGTATGGTTGTSTGTTTGTVTTPPVTMLPPITATPAPVTSPSAEATPPPPPPPPGSRPPGSGVDFCQEGDPGAQPVAGDYFLCPDDDPGSDSSSEDDGV